MFVLLFDGLVYEMFGVWIKVILMVEIFVFWGLGLEWLSCFKMKKIFFDWIRLGLIYDKFSIYYNWDLYRWVCYMVYRICVYL